jgi:hypothetical protein
LINGVHAIRMIIEERVDEEQNQKKEWHWPVLDDMAYWIPMET